MKKLKSPRSLTTQINKHYSGGNVVLMLHNKQYYLTAIEGLRLPAMKGIIKMRINFLNMWDTKSITEKIERSRLPFPLEVEIK